MALFRLIDYEFDHMSWDAGDFNPPFNNTNYTSCFITKVFYGNNLESMSDITVFSRCIATSNTLANPGGNCYNWTDHNEIETIYGYVQLANGQCSYVNSFTVDFSALPDPPAAATGLTTEIVKWNGNYCDINFTWDKVWEDHITNYWWSYSLYIYDPNSSTRYDYEYVDYIVSRYYNGVTYNITVNETYIFKIVVRNAGGISPATTSITIPSNSLAPRISNLHTTNVTSNSITVAWDSTDMSETGINYYTVGLSGRIAETTSNTNYTFNNLLSNITYNITVGVYDNAGNYSGNAYSVVIDIRTLGNNFEWDIAKVQGQSVTQNLTGVEWTKFQTAINNKRNSYSLSPYSFTSVSTGLNLTASIFNEVITAINQIYTAKSQTTQIIDEIKNGVQGLSEDVIWEVKASYFNNIRDALNNA